MNRNRLNVLLVLAAALALSACGAAADKSGGDRAAAAPSAATPSPAPTAGEVANVATANVSATTSTPSSAGGAARQAGSKAGSPGGASNSPPATVPTAQIGSGGNDFFLFTQARAAVNADPELRAANLILDVKDGVVTLSGTVKSGEQKSKAEQLVRGAGPRTVRNQLRVSAGN